MTSLLGKVVIVTGASSGIGKALCGSLVAIGSKVIGCARNLETLTKTADELNVNGAIGEFRPFKCDVSQEEDMLALFKYVQDTCGRLDALVNNAGMAEPEALLTGSTEAWNRMLQVNVLGVAIGCREAVKLMRKCGVEFGHIINVGGISAHVVPKTKETHFYSAAKFAVRALTNGVRQELQEEKSRIRVTLFSPGGVQTEFRYRMYKDNPKLATDFYKRLPCMKPEETANSIISVLQTPTNVNVEEIIFVNN